MLVTGISLAQNRMIVNIIYESFSDFFYRDKQYKKTANESIVCCQEAKDCLCIVFAADQGEELSGE